VIRIAVTGADGFIGKNLMIALSRHAGVETIPIVRDTSPDQLAEAVRTSQVIVHLAGANRPPNEEEFSRTNVGLTEQVVSILGRSGAKPRIIFSSSVHAEGPTAYGASKRGAEEALARFARAGGVRVDLFRLPNVFGKWCRPNYNSGVATFAHNIARDLPVNVHDEAAPLTLVYVDDVVAAFIDSALSSDAAPGVRRPSVTPTYTRTLGSIVSLLQEFRASRETLFMPDLSDRFAVNLYATYLSYLEPAEVAYSLRAHTDDRGTLAELFKSAHAGQMFVSRTHPGVTRGRHFHDTKTEKFVVVQGSAVVRFRSMRDGTQFEVAVDGREFRVIDIPPGIAHSITNTGTGELVTLFWASEIFDPQRPDTFAAET
jgi:UDP-2-acetamido-2,6-beta-L-arabino-hexul-4-ose reductase